MLEDGELVNKKMARGSAKKEEELNSNESASPLQALLCRVLCRVLHK
jgi:hypothetical protein